MLPTDVEKNNGLHSPENESTATRSIVRGWLDEIVAKPISGLREPIINQEILFNLLVEAMTTKQPIAFVAIGCQNWIKPEWGDSQKDWLLGRIHDGNKRAHRFTQEVASFSQSLASLRVPHRLHFSLSDVEPNVHLSLKNMGATIHNDDAAQFLVENVSYLTDCMKMKGVPVQPFLHTDLLIQEILECRDLLDLQQKILQGSAIDYRVFLDKLYSLDLSRTAQHFTQDGALGPVWLDVQSLNSQEDVVALAEAAKIVAPRMPILTIFPNAGNWHAKPQSTVSFPTKESIVAKMIGAHTIPTNSNEWSNRVHKTQDQVLLNLLGQFGQVMETIQSGEEKTNAVRLFMQLVFGIDPLLKQEDV